MNFPISPFFDIDIIRSTLLFKQRMQFLCGSSLYVDRESALLFSYSGDYYAQISILDRPVHYYMNDFTNRTLVYSDAKDNASESYTEYHKNKTFWKYYGQPRVNVFGKILFQKGCSNSYIIAGPFDVSEDQIGYYTSSASDAVLYTKNSGQLNPFTFVKNNASINIQTYQFDTLLGDSTANGSYSKGYARPFYSSDRAYIVDSSYDLYGSFNTYTGVFTDEATGDCYYINSDGSFSFPDGGSATVKKCTYSDSTHLITDSDTGTSYVYFASMYGAFISSGTDAGTIDLSRINLSSVSVAYSSQYRRWIRIA